MKLNEVRDDPQSFSVSEVSERLKEKFPFPVTPHLFFAWERRLHLRQRVARWTPSISADQELQ